MLVSNVGMMIRLYKKKNRSMRRLTAVVAVLSSCTLLTMTASAQPGAENVNVDVGACLELETREQQLECYEERVNEVLQARDDEINTNEPETTTVSDTTVEPEPPQGSRRAERRAARESERQQRETERRQREADKAAEEAAVAAEVAVAAAAAAAAAAEDPNYTAGEIVARITQLREVEPDAYFVYLDNGQIWRQSSPKRYNLRIGAEVRLRPGRMGPSFRLTDPEVGNFIQVRRVQ